MTSAHGRTAGIDIGGANLKVAVAERGILTAVHQLPCPLWRGVDQLEVRLCEIAPLVAGADEIRITMTGELADVFPDRYTGVSRIVELAAAAFGARIRIWRAERCAGPVTASETTTGGSYAAAVCVGDFCQPADAAESWRSIASMNYLATAQFIASRPLLENKSGLLIDIGSTTTDIIPFSIGQAVPAAMGDGDRLECGELVYTGLTRTPVPSVTMRGVFNGRTQRLAAEPFATMADVYRILRRLPEGVDHQTTADGRGTTIPECIDRLARCFGRDGEDATPEVWTEAAAYFAEAQQLSILDGIRQVISARPACQGLIVSAGVGASLISGLATRLGSKHMSFAEAAGIAGDHAIAAAHAAPAVALALMNGVPVLR